MLSHPVRFGNRMVMRRAETMTFPPKKALRNT